MSIFAPELNRRKQAVIIYISVDAHDLIENVWNNWTTKYITDSIKMHYLQYVQNQSF